MTLICTVTLFLIAYPVSAHAVSIRTSETVTLNELEFYRATQCESEEAKSYEGEYIERGSEVYGLAGVLTAEIVCTSASASKYNVYYRWSWDHAPFVNAVDAVGIRWVAIASDGLPVDTFAFSSEASIRYTYFYGDSIAGVVC